MSAATGAMVSLLARQAGAQTHEEALHRRLLVLDSHVDLATGGADDQASLSKLRAGGVDAVVLAAFAPTGQQTPSARAEARALVYAKLKAIHTLAQGPDAAIARTPDDVRRIAGEGRVAIIVGFLNAYPLARVDEFDDLHARDVRVAGLVHAGHTIFADSSRPGDEEGYRFGGLSELGRNAVRRLNDLGVLVDVSQLSANGVFQTVELSRAPVVASHSGVRALADHPRNLSDAEIDAIAAKGGVIQLTPSRAYLFHKPADYDARLSALRAQYGLGTGAGYSGSEALAPARRADFTQAFRDLYPRASVKTFVDQVEYVANRVGIDHVGIGSDFNHGGGVEGFGDESQAPNVTRALLARGFAADHVAKVWSGNFLRVLEGAERARQVAG